MADEEIEKGLPTETAPLFDELGLPVPPPPFINPDLGDKLVKQLVRLIEKYEHAHLDLIVEYSRVREDAVSELPITAEHYRKIESRFESDITAIDKQAHDLITAQINQVLDLENITDPENRKKRIKSALFEWELATATSILVLKSSDDVKEWRKENLSPLHTAFLDGVSVDTQKTLAKNANQSSEIDLIVDLLTKNPGIALGDVHTHDETSNFIAQHIDKFKGAGVDTIYIEFPSDYFKKINQLTVGELHQLVRDREYGDIKLPSAELNAMAYGARKSDDSFAAIMKMIAAAKENGIRVVNIDKPGDVRDVECDLSPNHRVASTNFTWTQSIAEDRETLKEEGMEAGKYIVWGGVGHFTNAFTRKGLVDDGLGIPFIAFTNRPKDASPAVIPGIGWSGADYYFNGGADYSPAERIAFSEDVKHVTEKLEAVKSLPEVAIAVGILKGATYVIDQSIKADFYARPVASEEPKIPPPPPLPITEASTGVTKSR